MQIGHQQAYLLPFGYQIKREIGWLELSLEIDRIEELNLLIGMLEVPI